MIEAWFDGACWPNPNGHAACGAIVKCDGVAIYKGSKYLGCEITSNNSAEYAGLILVLEFLLENQISEATIYGDSNLVIQQISGVWKVKRKQPKIYHANYEIARELATKLPLLKYKWVSRVYNIEADALSTQSLKERGLRSY